MINKKAKVLSKEYIISIIVAIIILLIVLFIFGPESMQKIGEFFKSIEVSLGMDKVRETVHSWWK